VKLDLAGAQLNTHRTKAGGALMQPRGMQSLVIEGYASRSALRIWRADVARAGAFTRSLARGGGVGMLLSHVGGRTAGRWTLMREDGRGLFVRGLVSDETASATALRMIAREGLDGCRSGSWRGTGRRA